MSPRVLLQRIPHLNAIALAVVGWSPVTMITLIPAVAIPNRASSGQVCGCSAAGTEGACLSRRRYIRLGR
eukprot:scaffold11393_cov167-Skeletonema_menzelii.AAC.1